MTTDRQFAREILNQGVDGFEAITGFRPTASESLVGAIECIITLGRLTGQPERVADLIFKMLVQMFVQEMAVEAICEAVKRPEFERDLMLAMLGKEEAQA